MCSGTSVEIYHENSFGFNNEQSEKILSYMEPSEEIELNGE